MHRKNNIEKIEDEIFDIAIIGGGITGAGILYEAGKAGYNSILIEKNDFASGTSSRSAKLVHGGLRYLKYGQFGLVREGLKERHYLLHLFPNLVKPLEFLLPVYGSGFSYSIAMWIYNLFSLDNQLKKYRYLSKAETLEFFPAINPDNLSGSFIYFDAVTNDARLTNEVIHYSNEVFNTVSLNYCEFLKATDRDIHFMIQCKDHIENRIINISSKYIVNAGGPWTDEILHRLNAANSSNTAPSKGVHLVFSKEKIPLKSAVVFSSYAGDGRMLYAIPWENNSVIVGATDTEFIGNPDSVSTTAEDIFYIINSLKHFVPALNITETDILSSFAGLRPLLKEGKQSKDRTRDYRCWWSHKRILNIVGGKMTGFHAMATSVLKKLGEELPPTQKPPVRFLSLESNGKEMEKISQNMQTEILSKYGHNSLKVLNIALESEKYRNYLRYDIEIYPAEIIYFLRYQNAYHLKDMLTRRLSLSYVLNKYEDKKGIVNKIAALMKQEFHWTEEENKNEIRNYWDTHKTYEWK